jgi:hypothetical protein
MRRTAVLATAFLLAVVTNANANERTVPQGWLGVTVDGPMEVGDAAEWDRMPRAGVETVRTAFSWAQLQPRPPDGVAASATTDFAATDGVVIAAARRRLALLPVVQWPPSWAALPLGLLNSPPADPADVRRIFTALVERYGPRGSLWSEHPDLRPVQIRSWQVFNEPNLWGYWPVEPFAPSYTATLEAAARGIRAADPAATVVLGGLTGASWLALDALYAAGARGAFDAVAIHPYTARPADVLRIVRYARRVMASNGDATTPVWITELSWPAAAGRIRDTPDWTAIGDRAQAKLLNRVMRRFVAVRRRLRIERLLWYTWLSAETGATAWDYAGLRRIDDGARRITPALRVFRRWARRLEGCPKTRDARRCR